MQCRAALTRIDALRTRELAPIEQTAVEQHLKSCRSCNESTSDVDTLVHAVKSLAVAPAHSCRDDVKSACVDSYDRVETAAGNVWVAFSKSGIRMITTAESVDPLRAPERAPAPPTAGGTSANFAAGSVRLAGGLLAGASAFALWHGLGSAIAQALCGTP